MKLKRLKISKYKRLREFEISFSNYDDLSCQTSYLIGQNGSGKSSYLEALTLIISRITQNEVPGFYFELEYIVEFNDVKYVVMVRPAVGLEKENSNLFFSVNDEKMSSSDIYFGDKNYILPMRIIAFASGPNNILDNIVYDSAVDSLKSDLYDLSDENIEDNDVESREVNMNILVKQIENLLTNPRCLFIDNTTSKLAIFIMLSFVPQENEMNDSMYKYVKLREKIMNYIKSDIKAVSVSFNCFDSIDNFSEQEELRSSNFIRAINSVSKESGSSWSSTISTSENDELYAYSYLLKDKGTNSELSFVEEFRELNPISLLSELIYLKRSGKVKDVNIAFRANENMILDDILSDGELLWLGKLALILINTTFGIQNTLFIFDEPDIFLNESWISSFVTITNEILNSSYISKSFGMFVSTHSSLLLTDVEQEDVYKFYIEENRVKYQKPSISSFGSDIESIYKYYFKDQSIKQYSQEKIDNAILNNDREKLEELLTTVGPGYNRFRLLDKIYDEER